MKIGLIGPGIIQIPPIGWGAVEILIWDYYNELKNLGHDVQIINQMRHNDYEQLNSTSSYCNQLIKTINDCNFDFVHIHYDCLYHIMEYLTCKHIAITSHYPYINQLEKHNADNYTDIFRFLTTQQRYYNFVLNNRDYLTFINNGANVYNLFKLKNGITSKLFKFDIQPSYDITIYLGQITQRKNQSKYQSISQIDFVGKSEDIRFDVSKSNYLGEWTREQVHNLLTTYSNLLLISNGEADPLVVKEALIAGLGIVINKSSSENLEEKEFISIIPDDKINDILYVENILKENRLISSKQRQQIHEYGINNFDIKHITKSYIEIISNL